MTRDKRGPALSLLIRKLENHFVREPSHLIDVMATAVDASGASYPSKYKGAEIAPLAGKSLVPLLKGEKFERGDPIFWG